MPNDAYECPKVLLNVDKSAKLVIVSDLCNKVRIFALMNVSSHYWSTFHANDCVYSRNEQQKVQSRYLTGMCSFIIRVSWKHACVLPMLELSAIGVDYDPLRSSATNLGSMVRISWFHGIAYRKSFPAPSTSPVGGNQISLKCRAFLHPTPQQSLSPCYPLGAGAKRRMTSQTMATSSGLTASLPRQSWIPFTT